MECALHVKLCDSVREGDRKIEPFRQLYRSARSLQSLIVITCFYSPIHESKMVCVCVCVCVCAGVHTVLVLGPSDGRAQLTGVARMVCQQVQQSRMASRDVDINLINNRLVG